MPVTTVSPQFSQMMQTYLGQEGTFPSLWQGLPSYGATLEEDMYNPDPHAFFQAWGLPPYERYGPEGHLRRHPTNVVSSYKRHEEQADVLDFIFEQEESRATVKSERFKLGDLLADLQYTGPNALKIGGVSKELEGQRGIINQGLIDLDTIRNQQNKIQELTLLQDMFQLRQDYETEIGSDYLDWVMSQPLLVEEEVPFTPEEEYDDTPTQLPGEYSLPTGSCATDPNNFCCNQATGVWSGPGCTTEESDYDPGEHCTSDEYWNVYYQECMSIEEEQSYADCVEGEYYDFDGHCLPIPDCPEGTGFNVAAQACVALCDDEDACNTGQAASCKYPDPDTGECYANPFG